MKTSPSASVSPRTSIDAAWAAFEAGEQAKTNAEKDVLWHLYFKKRSPFVLVIPLPTSQTGVSIEKGRQMLNKLAAAD